VRGVKSHAGLGRGPGPKVSLSLDELALGETSLGKASLSEMTWYPHFYHLKLHRKAHL